MAKRKPEHVKPRYWKTLARHPLSAKYPDLPEVDRDRMAAYLKSYGIVNNRTVKLWPDAEDGDKLKVVDGWQLYTACVATAIEPTFEVLKLPKDMTIEEYVDIVNDTRRHESDATRTKRIKERVARIVAAREAGQSLRAIAEAEGISVATTQRNLAGVPGGTPEGGKVVGKDGRKHPANRPARKLCTRCERDQRVGKASRKNCPVCRDLNKQAKEKKGKETPADDGPRDNHGNVLPKSLRDAFCDPWISDMLDLLLNCSEAIREARLADAMQKRASRYPFFKSTDFCDAVGFVIKYLDDLIEHLETERPDGICPACKGKKCAECRMSGLVGKSRYAEIAALAKEVAAS